MKKQKRRLGLGPLPEWNLDDLYPGTDSKELKRDFEWLEKACADFSASYQGKIASLDPDRLLECIQARERIDSVAARIKAFADLRFSLDSSDPARGKFSGDCNERITGLVSPLVFFEIEFNRIPQADYEAMLEAEPGLRRYRQALDGCRKLRPHQLSPELERYISERAVVGRSAWTRLFDETISSMRFRVGDASLNIQQALDRMNSPARAVREESAKAFSKEFAERLPLFALITNTLAKDKEIDDGWRKYETPQSARHLSNEVEPEVVDAMTKAVADAYPAVSHRYYCLKAKWLGLDKLEIWDRNAPLPDSDERRIPWKTAKSIVLDSFDSFSPRMAGTASDFFKNGWIDAGVKDGKSPGGFCHPTAAAVHPYILVNYQGQPRDVMVLAHELGHGVHQVLSAEQGEWLSQTPLTLAETASVFGEMLTFRSLLEQVKTPIERRSLLAGKVEDMINTVVRQVAFHIFESKLHERRRKGELTKDEINSIWTETQRECLGPAFNFMDGYEVFWAYIPHFVFAPFYVYSYAFGSGLAQALFARSQCSPEGFADRYLELLNAGGSRPYREMLNPFGIDVADPKFWDAGLTTVSDLIDELEELEGSLENAN